MKISSNGKTYWFPDSVTITDFIKMTEGYAFRHAGFVLDDLTGEVLKGSVDMEHVIDVYMYMESLKGGYNASNAKPRYTREAGFLS